MTDKQALKAAWEAYADLARVLGYGGLVDHRGHLHVALQMLIVAIEADREIDALIENGDLKKAENIVQETHNRAVEWFQKRLLNGEVTILD